MRGDRNTTHCPKNHEYTPENTRYVYSRGYRCRACKACQRKASRDRSARLIREARTPGVQDNNLVYFISDGMGHVKIGVAKDPERRMYELQIGNAFQLTLLAVESGGQPREKALHKVFRDLRVRGEWFTLTPALQAYITSISD